MTLTPGFSICPRCRETYEGRVAQCVQCGHVYVPTEPIPGRAVYSRSVLAIAYGTLTLAGVGFAALAMWLTVGQQPAAAAEHGAQSVSASLTRPG